MTYNLSSIFYYLYFLLLIFSFRMILKKEQKKLKITPKKFRVNSRLSRKIENEICTSIAQTVDIVRIRIQHNREIR